MRLCRPTPAGTEEGSQRGPVDRRPARKLHIDADKSERHTDDRRNNHHRRGAAFVDHRSASRRLQQGRSACQLQGACRAHGVQGLRHSRDAPGHRYAPRDQHRDGIGRRRSRLQRYRRMRQRGDHGCDAAIDHHIDEDGECQSLADWRTGPVLHGGRQGREPADHGAARHRRHAPHGHHARRAAHPVSRHHVGDAERVCRGGISCHRLPRGYRCCAGHLRDPDSRQRRHRGRRSADRHEHRQSEWWRRFRVYCLAAERALRCDDAAHRSPAARPEGPHHQGGDRRFGRESLSLCVVGPERVQRHHHGHRRGQ
ncbi:hypothetical protein D9M72_423470 [compost metagenome]